MDGDVAKDILDTIRREKKRRVARLEREDSDYAYDLWQARDEPFLNELCLMMLISIHHDVERRLVKLAARFTGDEKRTVNADTYKRRVRHERQLLHAKGKGKLIAKLKLNSFPDWNGAMRTLQLLANCLKHSPSLTPDRPLLRHLKLPLVPGRRPTVSYAPLPESAIFRERLAISLKLPKHADYCDIIEEFLTRSEQFLKNVEKQKGVSPVKFGPVSLAKFIG
jgi:hypothetical protein